MRVRLTLRPGQPGTKGLLARYGKCLVCVRYRYDEQPRRRVKTVELIVERTPLCQGSCHVRPRDALHVASAIMGGARFFLSCDNKVTQMKQTRCYRKIGRSSREEYFSAMNPVRFSEKLQKGDVE